MLKNVIIPTLGLDMEGATIQKWLKAEGDKVSKDEAILLVETDKATTEINAPVSGIIKHILYGDGAFVPVTETVALIETSEADTSQLSISATSGSLEQTVAAPKTDVEPSPYETDRPNVANYGFVRPTVLSQPVPPDDRSPIRASPAARRLARDLGVDLAQVEGTGPLGRIQGEDVRRFASEIKSSVQTQPFFSEPVPTAEFDLPGRLVPLARKRKLTAERMALSTATVARLTMNADVDATEIVRWRSRVLPILQESKGIRVTYNDLLVKVVATALKDHPYLNARWTDRGIYLVKPINIGVAVAVDDGLVVPIVHNADEKSVDEISVELAELIAKAREDKLSLADITGGTFTITNLGMYGIDSFTPIVNPPEAAILGVGRIAERVVGVEGQMVLRPAMTLSLSFDHRIIDGAPAARFLQRVRQLLEEPYLLI